jgi:O-antigen/teichoic acid export membrane protein
VLVLSLVTIAQGLTESGLNAIGMRELAVREGAERDRLMRTLIGMRIALTTGGVFAAVAFAVIAGYQPVLIAGTLIAGVGLVLQMVQTTLAVPLQVQLRVGWVTVLDLVRQVITVALIVALVASGASLLPFFVVPIPAALVTLGMTAWLIRHEVPVRPSLGGEWRALTRDVLPYAIATAINVLYFRMAIIVTSLIASATQVGYFAASFRVIEVIVLIPGLIVSTAFPIFSRAARDDHKRLRYAVQRTYEASSALGGATALGLALGAPFVIAVIAGPDFAPAADVLRIQALAFAATFAAVTWGYALVSLHRHRELLTINGIALTLAIVLTLVLAQLDGARGAAIATVLGELTLCIAAAVALRRANPRLSPALGNVPKIALAAALGAAVILVPGIPSIVAAVLGVAIYAVVLLRLGGVPAELIHELRRLRQARAS